MDTTVVIIIGCKHEMSPTSTGCILFIKWGPGNWITKIHKSHLWKKMRRQRQTFIRFCSVSIPSRATVDSNHSSVEPSAHLTVYIFQYRDSVNTNRVQILGWRERNQRDATNLKFIIKLSSQHVSGIIMPIISRTRVCTAAYGVPHWLWWL